MQPRHTFVLRIQMNRRKPFRAKSFVRRLTFLVGLGLLARFFERQNPQCPVLRVVRLAFRGFAEISRRCGGVIGLPCKNAPTAWNAAFGGIQPRPAAQTTLRRPPPPPP